MTSDILSKHWVKLAEALKSYIKDYDYGVFPYTKRGNEANFQASLFYELVKNHDYPEVELETSFGKMKPDLVLGEDKVMCEIKTTAGEKRVVKDIEKAMQYLEIAPISVVIVNCQYSASGALKSYLDNNKYNLLPVEMLNTLPAEKSYYMLRFEKTIDRGI